MVDDIQNPQAAVLQQEEYLPSKNYIELLYQIENDPVHVSNLVQFQEHVAFPSGQAVGGGEDPFGANSFMKVFI
nr:gustatory receptor [Semanotus bifasciatus]